METKSNWTSDNIPDQTDRIAIVTGANTGIGYETAYALCKKKATVIMACRNKDKAKDAAKRITTELLDANVDLMHLDLSSQKTVKDFADEFKRKYDSLHLLINNAGVMMPPYTKTAEGYELQFGTNHIGHFVLTGLLLDMILNTKNSRIVTVSSTAHKRGNINFNDLNWETRDYNRIQAYCDSKIANLYFTFELQRKLDNAGSSTIAVAAHPGWTGTELQRHAGFFRFLNPIVSQKPYMGALPTLYAATVTDVKGADYYGPAGFQEMRGYPKKVTPNNRSLDKEIAAHLWDISENSTKVRYRI